MLEDADKAININSKSWTNVKSKNISAYAKSKTLAKNAACDFVNAQKDTPRMEPAVINPGPVFGSTLSGNFKGTSMGMFKQMMIGKMPLMPQASINMSDERDIAKIHVLALENEKANWKRCIVTAEGPVAFQEVAKILKSKRYSKVSIKLTPDFLLKIMGYMDREAKSMRTFIGKTYSGDVSSVMEIFEWKPRALGKTILDTVTSLEPYLNKID
jgi:dihydroflavonol-4-reductase